MPTVKGNHPIMEIVACKMFGITGVPKKYQEKMVNTCAKAVLEYHDKIISEKDKMFNTLWGDYAILLAKEKSEIPCDRCVGTEEGDCLAFDCIHHNKLENLFEAREEE